MISRIQLLVSLVILLVAANPLASEERHMQFKMREYPINEEFRSVVEPTGEEDPLLGKAGDYLVKQSDVDRLLAYYPSETKIRLEKNPAEMQTLVRRMLEVKIIADLARKEKFDQIPQIKKQLDYVVDDFLSKEYLAKVVSNNVTVSETDLRKYYTQNKKQLEVPEQVWARHILFKVDPAGSKEEKKKARERAEAILKRAKEGEDFAELARAHSDDEGSKENGGDLGYFTRGRTVPAFEAVAFDTRPGEISDIVETRYGYHIIRVEDHLEVRERSFEEMRYYIRDELQQQVVASMVEEFIREATESADMQVYSDRISAK